MLDFFYMHSMIQNRRKYQTRSANKLDSKGLLCIEARSKDDENRDKVYNEHFRRFLDINSLKKELIHKDFKIKFETESIGLSVYKNEDPCLLRIIAQKK